MNELKASEQEVINEIERIAKNLEEMKQIALKTPPVPLRRFVAITTLQNGINKAFVYDNETDLRLSDEDLTKWIEIGINAKKVFDDYGKKSNSGSEHALKFREWLKQVNA